MRKDSKVVYQFRNVGYPDSELATKPDNPVTLDQAIRDFILWLSGQKLTSRVEIRMARSDDKLYPPIKSHAPADQMQDYQALFASVIADSDSDEDEDSSDGR